jgi:hypothetical protein
MNDVEKQGPSGLSIAALVTGILGMGIIPIILGAVDLNKIKNKTSSPSGKGMDIAGIVLGALATLGYVIWAIVATVLISSALMSY